MIGLYRGGVNLFMGRAVIEADPSLFPRDVTFFRQEGDKQVPKNARQVGEKIVVEDGRVKEVDIFYAGHNPHVPGGVFTYSGYTGQPETLVQEIASVPA